MTTVLSPKVAAKRYLDAYPTASFARDANGFVELCEYVDSFWDLGLPVPEPLADDDYSPEWQYVVDVLDLVAEHVHPRGLTYLVPTALESYTLTNHFN